MLHDDRGAAQPAQPDRAGPVQPARRRLPAGQQQHQRGFAGAVGAGDREVFAGVHVEADRRQRVVVGVRVAEPHPVQPHRHRLHRPAIRRGVQLVHIGHTAQPLQHPGQRPPPDQRDDHDHDHGVDEDQPRPVLQRQREKAAQLVAERPDIRHTRDPRENGGAAFDHLGQAVDVGGDGVEDQVPQPGQHHQGGHVEGADHQAGDKGGGQHGRCSAASAFDDAGQPADIDAVDHRHEAAGPGDQKRDGAGGHRGREQHPDPVAVGQQPHRNRAQQRDARRERHDDRDDCRGRAQRGHHRGLREFAGLQRPNPGHRGRRAGRGHFIDSASRRATTHLGLVSKSM
ncbi:hypothetical protein C1Y40_05111 [Mycobacterium talmoniae]|uniref:Uncharacterized protein n=1 Tax=Mycobacterium talmoniae TaxID=1858794 RepID=A0A2S8BDL2_9MYCO|nr:hypothetical protein C1Y40_05111 [Mycobacterium talmoniae]